MENPVTAACGVQLSDPRQVVTPIDPIKTRNMLHKYNLLDDSNEIVYGFNVGIKSPPHATLLFQQPQIVYLRSRIYFKLHSLRAGSWPLLKSLQYNRAGIHNRTIPHIPTRISPQTRFIFLLYDSRPILPKRKTQMSICQFRDQFGQFPNSMGILQSSGRPHLVSSEQMYCSHLRHSNGISNHTSQARATIITLHTVEWCCVCGQSRYVWADFERGSLWSRGGHAGGNLQSSRVESHYKVGR